MDYPTANGSSKQSVTLKRFPPESTMGAERLMRDENNISIITLWALGYKIKCIN